MKSAGKARNNGLYRHIRTSKEIIRNLLNDYYKNKKNELLYGLDLPVLFPLYERLRYILIMRNKLYQETCYCQLAIQEEILVAPIFSMIIPSISCSSS